MRKIVVLFCLSLISATGFMGAIDKPKLIAEIEHDIYRTFRQEIGLISKDVDSMAQGDVALEKDLKNLYAEFNNPDERQAQKKLDEFCQKWGLEPIKISRITELGVIDKPKLISEIENYIFRKFRQEVHFVSIDVGPMSQGNAELEKDLKDFYAEFIKAVSEDKVQKKLDVLSEKWGLGSVRVNKFELGNQLITLAHDMALFNNLLE
ncbi:MAG: hypothetical protein WC707_02030 [Candidatus Babeliaceae bacterium]